MSSNALRILLVDDSPSRANLVEEGLIESGHRLVARLAPWEDLRQRLVQIQPDLVIVALDSPDRDTLESLRWVSREQPRPIVMFVEQSEPGLAAQALDAGVSAYVVDGLEAHRVKDVLEVAVARFEQFRALREEIDRGKADLEARKRIERAKGLLMRQRGWSEDEAYKALRRMAMDQNKRLVDAADSVIAVTKLLES